MEVIILEEYGYENALRGASYSFCDRSISMWEWWIEEKFNKIKKISKELIHNDGGHNKFLEGKNEINLVPITYKVTGPFALEPIGKVLVAYLMQEDVDGGKALLYHPPYEDDAGNGSYNICEKDKDGYYVDICEECYINI